MPEARQRSGANRYGNGNRWRTTLPYYDRRRRCASELEEFVPAGEQFKIAVLDDYQNVALSMADWSALDGRAAITVFNDHVADPDAVVARLQPFEIICVMRERTPMAGAIIERLPNLRLLASTCLAKTSIDLPASGERAARLAHTGDGP